MNSLELTNLIIELSHKKMIEYGWLKFLTLSTEEGEKVKSVFVRDIRKYFNNIPVHFQKEGIIFNNEVGTLIIGNDKIHVSIDKNGGLRSLWTIR